ncbi:MAG: TlyA family RNA methyltransferase [Desulfobacterales bacterium]|nr:TlyA family RNA methyltransferase [Desulfobacterales bacterium]
MINSKKKRLDVFIVEKGLVETREKAKALIMSGNVLVDNFPIDKPGYFVKPDSNIIIKETIPYVSRGGLKLESAIKHFQINPSGLICLDVGASTGGFTDCLIQHEAKQVFAVDVGYGQIAWKLRQDNRVVTIERTNARYMDPSVLPYPIDLITIDVSFISLKIIVPAVEKFLKQNGSILALIKPQFEVGKGKVGKGGIVRDKTLHDEVIEDLSNFFKNERNLDIVGIMPSPIIGAKGNQEFIINLKKLNP